MKALVAISVSREWNEAEFLMQMGTWHVPTGWQLKFGWFRQFTAAERHNVAINEAKYNYDRVLFIDTDQIYAPEYFAKMLAHDEPVVSALNVSRYYPYEFTTYDVDEETEGNGIPKFRAIQPPSGKSLFECDMTGTGSLMVDVDVLSKIEMPYFKDIYDGEGCVRLLADDFYFCHLLHKAGIKITIDQSIIVKHIAKIMVSAHNARDLRKAWDKTNSGYGYWKDGKK
jgi:hypothetical protein